MVRSHSRAPLRRTRGPSRGKTVPSNRRRTRIVWLCFVIAMTVVMGLLSLGERGLSSGFLVATNIGALGGQPEPEQDPVFRIDADLDGKRWTGIVIHHLGLPAGDAERVHRLHLGYGYQGLGYHFLIGNGSGLGDGIIHVGYRWNEQLPGAHVVGPEGDRHNQSSIGICLIGNGDRRQFTQKQMRSLVSLVGSLQRELDIPAEDVHLHRDLAPSVTSPGRFFTVASFREQIRNRSNSARVARRPLPE